MGKDFIVSNVASISIDKSYLLITPDSSLKINMAFSITSIPGSTLTILEDPTVSADGTSMTIINQNRNSTVTPTLSVFVDPNRYCHSISYTYSIIRIRWYISLFRDSNLRRLESAGMGISINTDWFRKYMKEEKLKVFTVSYDGIVEEKVYKELFI